MRPLRAPAPTTGRPQPLVAAANQATPLPAAVSSIVSALLVAGVITRGQLDLVTVLLGAGAAACAAIAALVAGRRTARVGQRDVTPLEDPVNAAGEELLPRGTLLLEEIAEQLLALRQPDPATEVPAAGISAGISDPPTLPPAAYVPVRVADLLAREGVESRRVIGRTDYR